MTDRSALILGLLNLAVIGALPRIFFRRGRLTAGWWLTASPFLASAVALLAALSGILEPVVTPQVVRAPVAVVLHAASLVMIGYTLGTHREPLSLWHQPGDTPRHIVTHGAYARIRHPFYTSFVLALLGAAVTCPHWLTVAAFVLGFAQLNRTAAREEAMLIDSPFSAEYRAYLSRSGRFWPRGRRTAALPTARWSR
jgi:protein-S-isoprenylcysteine O-methyltransferase Ste14